MKNRPIRQKEIGRNQKDTLKLFIVGVNCTNLTFKQIKIASRRIVNCPGVLATGFVKCSELRREVLQIEESGSEELI